MDNPAFNDAALPPLKDVIAAHDLRAKKSLGQNFLMDPHITDRIAMAIGDVHGKTLIEIGPGPGGLTRSLLRTAADKVVAIEFDPRACGAIHDLQEVAGGRLDLIQGDALKVDWHDVLGRHTPCMIAANLPYNISVILLMQWLRVMHDNPSLIDGMVLMFQREVADRIMAAPHNGDYGRVSVMAQWIADITHVMTLPPGAFVPPPKVHSSVLRIMPKKRTGAQPKWETLDRLLHDAFGQRRKMLRGTLKPYLSVLDAAGIDTTLRAENLEPSAFIDLAFRIERMG